jgi:hypothetical protein
MGQRRRRRRGGGTLMGGLVTDAPQATSRIRNFRVSGLTEVICSVDFWRTSAGKKWTAPLVRKSEL